MQNSSRKNIAGRSKMEDPSISLITSNDAICGTSMPVSIGGARGSPGKRMVLPKTEPPALSLTETVSVSAPLISQAQLQPQVQQPIKPTDEPLLIANPQRFVLFPVEHPDVMAMAKKAIAVFWTPEEIDLTKITTELEAKLKIASLWIEGAKNLMEAK